MKTIYLSNPKADYSGLSREDTIYTLLLHSDIPEEHVTECNYAWTQKPSSKDHFWLRGRPSDEKVEIVTKPLGEWVDNRAKEGGMNPFETLFIMECLDKNNHLLKK